MKKSEFLKNVLEGKPMILVEYRASRAEHIKWRDKETKMMVEGTTLSHTVENATDSIRISDRLAEGVKPEDYKSPYSKGDKVILQIRGLQVQKGVTTAVGDLLPFEDDSLAGSASAGKSLPK